MKFYKIPKHLLKWVDMPMAPVKMRTPLLIDEEFNVLLGNSLKERNNDYEIAIVVKKWEYYKVVLPTLEKEILEDKDAEQWLYKIDKQVCDYLKDEKIINEQISLFDFKEASLLTEENYQRGGAYDFKKASSRHKDEIDDQLRLIVFEDDEQLERLKKKEDDIKIDLEILKELL